jgi:hypothetical protein
MNGLNHFPVPNIKNEESMVILRCGEQAVMFQVDSEMVKPPFDFRGQLEGFFQRYWRICGVRCAYS